MAVNNIYVKKIINVFLANILNLFGSVVVTLFLPNILTVSDYGEWQYFLLLFTYVEVSQFGFAQGVYLRFGGAFFKSLNLGLLRSQIIVVISLLFAISVAIYGLINQDIGISFTCFLFCIPIMGWICFAQYILQATGKTDVYSKILILDKVLFVTTIVVSYIILNSYFGVFTIGNVMYCFIFSKIVTSLYSGICLRELLFFKGKRNSYSVVFREIRTNIRVGSTLIFSSLCSLLIIGAIRFIVVGDLGKAAYGRIAIILSLCSFVMVLVNAISVVIFPGLRRSLQKYDADIARIYGATYYMFNIVLIICLLFSYPIGYIFNNFLVKYQTSLDYLYIIMPVIIFDSNWSIFGSTIMKVYRKEKEMLKITISSMLASVIMASLVSIYLDDLKAYAYLMIIVLAIRFVITEFYIKKIFDINIINVNIMIIFSVVFFIAINTYFNMLYSMVVFSLYIVGLCSFNILKIKNDINYLRSLK